MQSTLNEQAVRVGTQYAPPLSSPVERRRNIAVLSHAEYVPTQTCDVCYLCANFGLPGPLCSRLRPDVRDRQT